MIKAFCGIAISLISVLCIYGQDIQSTATAIAPEAARFEIIQPIYDKTLTFRLDKVTGNIYKLGTCPRDDSFGSSKCWKEMIIVDLPKGTPNRNQFQIIINGPLKMILLMQVETGHTWQYGVDPLDKWHPFIECSDKTDRNCLWRP